MRWVYAASRSGPYSYQLDNPEEADMYFTDRLSAPTNTFEPPAPDVQADASGYLPDCELVPEYQRCCPYSQ